MAKMYGIEVGDTYGDPNGQGVWGKGPVAGSGVDWGAAATAAQATNEANQASNAKLTRRKAAANERLSKFGNAWYPGRLNDMALLEQENKFVNENLGTYTGPSSQAEANSAAWKALHPEYNTPAPAAPAPTPAPTSDAAGDIETIADKATAEADAAPSSQPQYTPDQAIRDQQMQLAQQIYLRATGQIPSAAELMLNKANQASMRQQLAAAASVRGGANAALVARTAQNNMADASVQNAANAGILRAQEQAQAEGQLGNILGQMRGQGAQEGQFNASMQLEYDKFVESRKLQLMGLGLDANKALLQAENEAANRMLQSSQFDRQLAQQASQFGQTQSLAERQFEENTRQAKLNYDFALKQADQAQDNADRQFWLQVGSAILGSAATVGAKAFVGA